VIDVDIRGQHRPLITRYRKPRTENKIEANFSVYLRQKSSHEGRCMLKNFDQPLSFGSRRLDEPTVPSSVEPRWKKYRKADIYRGGSGSANELTSLLESTLEVLL